MARPFKDFDEFTAEVQEETIGFRFRGEEYEVSAKIPFLARLRLGKMFSNKESAEKIKPDELFDTLIAVFGEDVLTRLERARATEEEFFDLLRYVFTAFQESDEESPNPKETAVPVKRGKSQ